MAVISNNDIRMYSKSTDLSEQFDSDGQIRKFIGRPQRYKNVEDVLVLELLFGKVRQSDGDGSYDLGRRAFRGILV